MLHTAKCVNCGKSYSGKRPIRGTTCSQRCAGEFHRQQREHRRCVGCGEDFLAIPSAAKRWCSIQCFNRRPIRNPDMIRTCKHCGNKYKRSPGQIKRRYCSRQCARTATYGQMQFQLSVATRANIRPERLSRRKRVLKFKSAFPRCNRCGWDKEPTILHVHHVDRDRTNCAASNLEVLCPTCHVLEHFQAGDAIWASGHK